jgi:hypothetical protein
MRLCSYVVKFDTGFAPNPLWGFCTLAACTPNHTRHKLKLEAGDWLLGHSALTETGRMLIYAMRISETLDLDKYFRDKRFEGKKARSKGWRERCGDNIYYRDDNGVYSGGDGSKWMQATAFFHAARNEIEKDLKHHFVFISEHFFYFGENAPALPPQFRSLEWPRQGVKCHAGEIAEQFVQWLEENHEPGVHGDPRDRDNEDDCGDINKRSVR